MEDGGFYTVRVEDEVRGYRLREGIRTPD